MEGRLRVAYLQLKCGPAFVNGSFCQDRYWPRVPLSAALAHHGHSEATAPRRRSIAVATLLGLGFKICCEKKAFGAEMSLKFVAKSSNLVSKQAVLLLG
jgi:hypothetical protein